jgi:hypothetical protein
MLGRMDRAIRNAARECEQALLDDMNTGSAGGGPGGGAPPGLPAPGGAPGGAGAQEEPSDSSRDAWFEPQSYADSDLTTYSWVEDENRKFNLLCLVSADEEFAKESYDRLIRVIDYLREGTSMDLGRGDAERMAGAIREWVEGKRRSEDRPRAPLKSNKDDSQITFPLVIEEILLLPEVPEDLFQDKVVDGVLIPGLDSVLTIYTALRFEEATAPPNASGSGTGAPASPSGNSGNAARQTTGSGGGRNAGEAGGGAPAGRQGATPAGGTTTTTTGGGNRSGGSGGAPGGNNQQLQDESVGVGVRININTASRAMLRGLLSDRELPPEIVEAILRHRNEDEDPEAARKAQAAAGATPEAGATTAEEEQKPKKKIFATLSALDDVEAFKNWGDMKAKEKFLSLLTTESDVFTIHFASVFKRNEEKKVFVIKRAATVVVRSADRDGSLFPLVPMCERPYLRVMPIDFPELAEEERRKRQDMEEFSLEERSWNPFFLEFYRKDK